MNYFLTQEITLRYQSNAISAFWKTHKCKLIPNWTRKTVWLLINNINMKKLAWKKCRKILLQTGSEHLTQIWHFIYWLADEDQLIMLRTQSGSFNNHNPEYRCVICTGVTLFALVLKLNCTALSQSESSNSFMYIIDKKIYRLLYSIYMVFTGSLIDLHENLQAPLLDLHDIYRLLYSIYMVFTGSFVRFTWKFTGFFIRFTWYIQAPLFDLHENLQAPLLDLRDIYGLFYSIYMVFTGSFVRFTWKFTGFFIRFTWYLQAPLFDLHENLQAPLLDLHDIYRPLYLIYMLFTGSFIRFTWYLQAPLFDLHCIHRLPYLIYMEIYRLHRSRLAWCLQCFHILSLTVKACQISLVYWLFAWMNLKRRSFPKTK